jgi:hypothetical protein
MAAASETVTALVSLRRGWIAWSLWVVAVVLALSAMILVVVTRSVPHSPMTVAFCPAADVGGNLPFRPLG